MHIGMIQAQSRAPVERFSGVPWDVLIARNPVINRLAIDLIGMETFSLTFARNKYERLERAMDFGFRLAIGFALPILSGRLIQNLYNKRLKTTFKQSFVGSKINPLAIPLAWLDKAQGSQGLARMARSSEGLAILKRSGLKNIAALTPALIAKLRQGKMWIMAADMFFMAVKGIAFFWAKNALTEKLSGKKGFSGEFAYTTQQYRDKKSTYYQAHKKRLHFISAVLGMGANLSLPIVVGMVLRSPQRAARSFFTSKSVGLVPRLKSLMPAFEYTDVIFMSRATMLIHALFNWNLAGAITARDSHERREHLLRTGVADFFFFAGDDLISAQAAQFFQKKYRSKLRFKDVAKKWKMIPITEKGPFGLTLAKPYHDLYYAMETGSLKALPVKTKQLLNQLGRTQFWTGLLGTALCLGVSVNVLNNWFTKNKVLREQGQ